MPRAATSVATSALHLAVGERGERALTLALRAVAVDRRAAHAALLELLGQRVGAVLGAAEHDRRAGGGDDLGGHVARGRRGRPPRTGASPRSGRPRGACGATGRAGSAAPAGRRRRRGWRRRAASGGSAGVRSSSACTAGRKPMSAMRSASSTTTISTSSRSDLAPLDQVGEAARAGDEHVDAASERLELGAEAGAAVDRGDAELAAAAEPLELAAHLRGELTGGDEHEGRGAASGVPCRRGRRAGCRTRWSCPSRSGARPQRSRPARPSGDGHGLDVEGVVETARVEGADELGGHAELGEGGAGHGWGRLLGDSCCGWVFREGGRTPKAPIRKRTGSARDAYPLAKHRGGNNDHALGIDIIVAGVMMGPCPLPRIVPSTRRPCTPSTCPRRPQRDRTIPATAWIEAPPELLALGRDLGHELVAYKRRIGPWLLWRAGPAAKGNARYAAIAADDPRAAATRSASTRRATAKASAPTASCTNGSARGRKRCATTRRGDVRCDLDAE